MERLATAFASVLRKHFEETDESFDEASFDFTTIMLTVAYSESRDMYMDDIDSKLPRDTAAADMRRLKSFIDQPAFVESTLVGLFLTRLVDALHR